jgi:uncharacterized damage-inducible protein DinB
MSVFTNPANGGPEQGAAYSHAIIELLGPRDPIAVLGATDGELRRAIDGMTDAQLTVPEAPGKWSVRHVLRHLADSDLVWGWRLRLVLAQDRPPLTGYDQDAWASRLHYDKEDAAVALEEFTVLRRANLRLLHRSKPEDLARFGLHPERGEESLAHMIRLYAGHDLLHLRQIARIRAAVVPYEDTD